MGTSMASPHVAGVAALIVASGVTDPDAVEKLLKETARPPKGMKELAPRKGENRYGAGIVDAQAAVKKAQLGEGAWELGLGLVGAALLFLRRRQAVALGAGGFAALVIGSSGLFFLPSLGVPGLHLLAQGLPAWDQALGGATAHGSPLAYSALIPIGAIALLYGFRRLRGVLAGLALGFAGHLLAHALFRTSDVRFIPDALDAAWLVANGGLAWLAAFAVVRKA
jgi:serine protease